MVELLPGFVSGELSAEERTAVLEMLRRSPELRREHERYRRLVLLLGAAAALEPAPPDDLSQRIRRQIALRQYLQSALGLFGELVATYGRAAAFYAGLSTPERQASS